MIFDYTRLVVWVARTTENLDLNNFRMQDVLTPLTVTVTLYFKLCFFYQRPQRGCVLNLNSYLIEWLTIKQYICIEDEQKKRTLTTNQLTQPTNQPTNQHINQPTNRLTQLIDQPTNQTTACIPGMSTQLRETNTRKHSHGHHPVFQSVEYTKL